MDLENIMLSEISKIEKDKYFITYMWNLKIMEHRDRLTDIENKVVTKGQREVGRDKLAVWD